MAEAPNAGDLSPNAGDLPPNAGDLKYPEHLQEQIGSITPKARKQQLWPVILHICSFKPHSAEQLGVLLNRLSKHLKSKHLNPMREEGLITYMFPEVANHPEQAYKTTPRGKKWLENL